MSSQKLCAFAKEVDAWRGDPLFIMNKSLSPYRSTRVDNNVSNASQNYWSNNAGRLTLQHQLCAAVKEPSTIVSVLTEKCGAWDESAEKAPTSHAASCVLERARCPRACCSALPPRLPAVFTRSPSFAGCWLAWGCFDPQAPNPHALTYSPRRVDSHRFTASLWWCWRTENKRLRQARNIAAESARRFLTLFVCVRRQPPTSTASAHTHWHPNTHNLFQVYSRYEIIKWWHRK